MFQGYRSWGWVRSYARYALHEGGLNRILPTRFRERLKAMSVISSVGTTYRRSYKRLPWPSCSMSAWTISSATKI